MDPAKIDIEPSWREVLKDEFQSAYFDKLVASVKKAKQSNSVYPPGKLLFQAFNAVPFHKVKVVILGQDPYHNPGEAMGLCFSVPRDTRIPPSLKNIYRELISDIQFKPPMHGDLSAWTERGVFLLNAMLTVEKNKPGSHRKMGWQTFTDAVIRKLSEEREGLVFMLWGNFARGKSTLIDASKHLVLEAAHPSPLARGAYFGSKHFSQANDYFRQNGQHTIDWSLPD